jgi:hypothetical protein
MHLEDYSASPWDYSSFLPADVILQKAESVELPALQGECTGTVNESHH